MNHKYFAISYEDPGTTNKLENEQQIKDDDWLTQINDGIADIFRVEVLPSGEAQVRRLIIDEERDDEGEKVLVIHDWELVV